MKNQEMINFINEYETENTLENAVKNDVMQRINDWLSYSHSDVTDEYISKQINYFNRYMEISSLLV